MCYISHDEFANADGNSPGDAEWSGVCTRARAGGKRDAQAHARTAAVLRAYVGRRMRPDDAARLERSSCVQNVQRVNQSGFHRAHRGVLLQSQYGLDARKWMVRPLTEQEKNELLQGPADLRAKQAVRFRIRQANCGRRSATHGCARWAKLFLSEWGDRFRRTAAARNYHHARRGGLVEHTAQMMRVATEIAPLYPQLNLDLLLTGILFPRLRKTLGERVAPKTDS